MAGLFDHLIPRPAPINPVGAFDHLIPQGRPAPQVPAYPTESQIQLAREQQALDAEREALTPSKAALQLALGTGEAGKGVLRQAIGGVLTALPYTGLLDVIPAYRRARQQFGRDVSELGAENVAEATELGEGLGGGTAGRVIRDLGTTFTASAPAIPAGLLGGLPAAAITAAGIQGGASFNQYKDYFMRVEKLPEQEAEYKALLPSMIGGAITGTLTRIIPGGTEMLLSKFASGELTRGGISGLIKMAVKEVAQEIPEEGLDQIGQGVTEKLLVNPNKPIGDIVDETLFAMFAAGTLAGTTAGGLTTIGKTAQAVARPIERGRAVRRLQAYRESPERRAELAGIRERQEAQGITESIMAAGQRRTRRIGEPYDTQTQREVLGPQPQGETIGRPIPEQEAGSQAAPASGVLQTPPTQEVLADEPVLPLRTGTKGTDWEDQRGRPVRLVPAPERGPGMQKWAIVPEEAPPVDPSNFIVSVQAPQGDVPGNVQIIDPTQGERDRSPTVESLRAAGIAVPDFSTLPQGQYKYSDAVALARPESVKPAAPEQRGAALPQVQVEGDIANYPGQEALLERVVQAINKQNAALPGLPIKRVRFSGEDRGPAMYALPGSGEFDRVWVNLPRIADHLARNPRADVDQFLSAVVSEEMIHNASGQAVFDEWKASAPQLDFNGFYSDRMVEIYSQMTPEQIERTVNTYHGPLRETGVASEFVRMLVQERMRGQITEETLGPRILQHLKDILRKLIAVFQTTTDPQAQSLIQSHVEAIQSILTEQGENPFDVMREAAGAEPPPVLTAQQQRAKEVTERARGRRPEAVGAAVPDSPKTPEEMDRALAVKEAEEEGWVKHRALGVDDWVLARDQWTDEEKLRSRQQAEETFTNAGIPHTWNEQNRYFDIQPGATVEAQYRLLDLVKEAMRRQNWPKEPEVAALIASITANAKLGQTDYFDSYVRRQLYKLTRSEASHRGALLGALSHFARDIREVSLRVEEILERTWADAYGGPAVEKVAEDLAKLVAQMSKAKEVADRILAKAPELTQAGVDAGLIGQIFQMPFFTQAELKERFIAAVVKKTRVTPSEATKLWNVFKEKFDPIRRELGRLALAEVKSLLRPDQRHLIKKPIWQKIQSMVDAGEFDAGHILKIIAGEKGWRTPTPEEISKLRQLARRERELRELNDKERAEVEKFAPNDEKAMVKAQLEKEKKTEQQRNAILREMDTRWARFTRPISLNPFKWFGLRHNTASAGLELIAANLLATVGFPFRLSISIASQILPHMTLTPIAYSWQQHQGTLDTLEGQKNFIRDAYLGLEDSISAYLKSVKPAAYAARAAFLGRGEQRNVLRLTSSIAAFDRIRLMAQEEFEKGNVAKAWALKTLGFLDIGFRAARALDAFQTLPAETAEMYHQIRLEMGSQGKSLTEIKNNQYTIMDRIFREWMQAIADTKKGLADAGVTDATEAQIKEIAWTLIRQRQYQKANELKLSGDDWQRMNRLLKSTLAWNEAETKGAGGVVGGALKRIQRGVSKGLGIPTDIGVFSNAIATAINRQLHFTPAYHFMGGGRGEGSPWFATEIDRKRRALDALAGTGFGGIVIAMVLMGIIKVQLPRRMDDDEKEKFIAEGHRFGTVEFQYGDTFVPVSMNNSPLWIVAPYLAGAGALMDLWERRQKEQEKLNAEAAKKGLPPGKIRPMDPGDMAGVAGQAIWQTIFGSRTFSGFLGSVASYGEKLNTRRIIAGRIAPMVPGLPAVREVVSRMGGVTLNNQMATVWDYMLPLPSSQAAMVNKLGDPVRTPSDLQRVVQVLSGGNYGPVAKQETQAYQTLYGSEFKPPTISPNKGYQFPDSFRPMNDRELSRYSILRGRYFQEGLAGVAAGDEAAVKSAYQQAERRALTEVGVEVPAPKATTARGTTTTRRTTIRGPRRLRSVSRLRRPRLRRLSYRRPRLAVRRPRLRRIRRLAA